jgi:hypothetical protein
VFDRRSHLSSASSRGAGLVIGLVLASTAAACGASGSAIKGSVSLRSKITIPRHNPAAATVHGTFSASGAVDDSGSVVDEYRVIRRGHVVEQRTYRGRHGSIMVAADVRTSDTRVVTGTWRIESGTRAYSNLNGKGRITGFLHNIAATGGTLFEDKFSGEVSGS